VTCFFSIHLHLINSLRVLRPKAFLLTFRNTCFAQESPSDSLPQDPCLLASDHVADRPVTCPHNSAASKTLVYPARPWGYASYNFIYPALVVIVSEQRVIWIRRILLKQCWQLRESAGELDRNIGKSREFLHKQHILFMIGVRFCG
jgi:hypothetical protein